MPHYFISSPSIEEGEILFKRRDGQAWTNVPCLVVLHSPSGFEWGYAGSGPADLALNIIENRLRRMERRLCEMGFKAAKTGCFRGEAFRASLVLHQDLKYQAIASMPRKGGRLFTAAVDHWLMEKLIERKFI